MAIDSLSLPLPGLKTALAEALYNEILSNTNNYYYFIGKSLEWNGGVDAIVAPENTLAGEADARNEMIFFKKVTSADVAFTVPRYNWVTGQVYDMYDDRLGDSVTYSATTTANSLYLNGTFDLNEFGVGWKVTGDGIAENTYVDEATPTQVTLTKRTSGIVTSATFTKLGIADASSLETAKFYVVTSDNAVYKCLNNNQGAPSTVKPYATTHEPVTLSDGYVWKYMYTIPSSLVNKFMTLYDMPVTTSVRSAYYSNGTIGSLRVLNYGAEYLATDTLAVTGDGNRTGNRFQLASVSITNSGSGYTTTPTVTFSDPFDNVFDWEQETDVLSGQYLKVSDGKIYLVITGGTTGTVEPTHTSNISQPNGTAALRFVGLTTQGTVSLDGDNVDGITMEGFIGFIDVRNIGSGYDPQDPPGVTITSAGTGAGAQAYAQVSADGHITGIVLTNRGSGYSGAITVEIDPPVSGVEATATASIYYGFGYSSIPTATVSAPFVADAMFVPDAAVAIGDIIQASHRFYEVEANGTLGATAPTHTTGTVDNLTYLGETAEASVNAIKTEAVLRPIVEGGQIVGVIIVDGGEGYTTATVSASSGTGAGAVIEADLSLGDLNTRQANSELLAVPGTIDAIEVLHPGLNYATATVTITGDGTGATAEAVIVQGAITKINVTNVGVNYTHAVVTITGNEGATQAYARAIVSPVGGHGKNAIKELYATDLSLATTIAQDRNQGFVVDNEYRQLGLIKNPTDPATGYRSTRITASACFVIAGDFVYNDVPEDTELHDDEGHTYHVVARPATAPLAGPVSLLVSSPDNISPTVGEVVSYANTTATISSITNPTIDKYSGELLFIDNRASFKPTDEQTVSIKTVIRL